MADSKLTALPDLGTTPAADDEFYIVTDTGGTPTSKSVKYSDLGIGGGGGGTVESVTGDSVDNTDPANPVVNAIPLSGTEVGNPVTGSVKFSSGVSLRELITDVQANLFDSFTSFGLELVDDNKQGFIGIITEVDEGASPVIYYYDNDFDIAKFFNLDQWEINEIGGARTLIALDNSTSGGVGITATEPTAKGLYGSIYFGANYTDLTYIQKKYVDDNFIQESDVVDTNRAYTKGQQITEVALSISTSLVAVNLANSNAFTLDHSENCTISNPTGLIASSGSSWDILVTVTGAGGWMMALDTDYYWIDDGAAPTFPNVTDDEYYLFMRTRANGKTAVSLFPFQ